MWGLPSLIGTVLVRRTFGDAGVQVIATDSADYLQACRYSPNSYIFVTSRSLPTRVGIASPLSHKSLIINDDE